MRKPMPKILLAGGSNDCGHLFICSKRALCPTNAKAHIPHSCNLHSPTFGLGTYRLAHPSNRFNAFGWRLECLNDERTVWRSVSFGFSDRNSATVPPLINHP